MKTIEQMVSRYVAMRHETDAAVRRQTIAELLGSGRRELSDIGRLSWSCRNRGAGDRLARENVVQGRNRFRARPSVKVVQNGVLLTWEMLPRDSEYRACCRP